MQVLTPQLRYRLNMGCCGTSALAFVEIEHETSANLAGSSQHSNLQRTIRRQTLLKSDHLKPASGNDAILSNRFRGLSLKNSKSIFKKSSFIVDRIADLATLYKIEGILGEGSFGKVTRATNKRTGEVCAIKTLRYDSLSMTRVEALFREVDILKELVKARQDHPYIVKIYQVIHEETQLHIITELCTGGELFGRLVTKGTFGEVEAAEYMFQILSAVNYLHINSIVHRDIKPENLLLANSEANSPLKLIDFGTSQICEPLKKLSQVAGTPYYIAPEILKGTYDEKCDIWSCGVILFMMLSGKPPFIGEDREELFGNILVGKYSMEGPHWEAATSQVKDLVQLMLSIDPSVRPSAKDVLSHTWIKHRNKALNSPRPSDVRSIKNLARFRVIAN